MTDKNSMKFIKKLLVRLMNLLDGAKQSVRDVRLNSINDVDEILSKAETMLKEAMLSFKKQTAALMTNFQI